MHAGRRAGPPALLPECGDCRASHPVVVRMGAQPPAICLNASGVPGADVSSAHGTDVSSALGHGLGRRADGTSAPTCVTGNKGLLPPTANDQLPAVEHSEFAVCSSQE